MSVPRRFAVFALMAGLAFIGVQTWAQRAASTVAPPNFDIRTENAAGTEKSAAAYMARVLSAAGGAGARTGFAEARAAGLARLRSAFTDIEVVDNPELGTTEVVGVKAGGGFLTAASADRVGAMRGFLSSYADLYGLSQDQVASLELVADYANPAGNMAWVEFEEKVNGLPVFRGLIRGGFTASGALARTTGPLAAGLAAAQLATAPTLTAAQAVSQAAANVGWRVDAAALVQQRNDAGKVTFARATMADEPKAWLLYFPLAPGVARLAWATEIWGDPDVFLIVVDAEDGTVLFRKNLTSYQTQPATYSVYNDDSPAPMSPSTILPGSGTQAPVISRTLFTLIGNEAPNTFNNLGWMTDGTNVTDGNNVQAGIDRDGTNGVDAPATGSPNRVFNFPYNPGPGSPAPGDDPLSADYQNGEVTDGFYWTNVYHDRLYLLGFTEAAHNFQNDNFGRFGFPGDRISAEFQDSSGTNNANFAAPSDGSRGRLQMFIFTGPTPNRSSGLDHDVLLHELTHGTSNRLHLDSGGLSTIMSAGMGEGWSDFFARALLSSEAEDVNGIYTTRGWVTNLLAAGYTDNYYYGMRRFPYAVKTTLGANGKPHNPLTFADIDASQLNLSDGAFPCNPIFSCTANAFEVHNIGEVWAMALLEVRARFITRLGFAVGNQQILQFVTDGMKLDPANPTLLQGRDSIIAAANAGGTAADVADIWAGFATRGMGVVATVINAATGSVAENFNVPGDPVPTFSINDVSLTEGTVGTKTFTFDVTLANPSLSESRVGFATADGTTTSAGSNYTKTANAEITIPDLGAATPYPATLFVFGLPTTTVRVKARLNSVRHTFPANLDILLVGPGGQKVMLMSDAGGGGDISGSLTFDDGAPFMTNAQLETGTTYAPTDLEPGDTLPGPAPGGPYGTSLSVFNGTNPNGTWSLYVVDDSAGDAGSIEGFSLIVMVAGADFVTASGQLIFPPGTTTQPVNVTVISDKEVEGDETFFVNLLSPVNARIGDAQGQGTIINDDGDPVMPPSVTTSAATNVTATGATLNGIVNPNGSSTTALFEYDLITPYGSQVTVSPAPGSGTSPVAVSAAIAGLVCDTPYHFRAVATNGGGTTNGADAVFRTGACEPTIAFIPGVLTRINTPVVVPLTVASRDGAAGLTVTGRSSNQALVPDENLVFGGSGASRTLTITPAANQKGATRITVSASDGTGTGIRSFVLQVGLATRGDFDGDGRSEIGVFRPSTGAWYLRGLSTTTWGGGADIPVAGDYDGDGKTDIAVYRPSTGTWYILLSSTGTGLVTTWGGGEDIPTPGDYDGDGKTDIGVFRPSTGVWYILPSSPPPLPVPVEIHWGDVGDIPVAGDYYGDGTTDFAVFRPSTGVWYILHSGLGTGRVAPWGGGADIPVAADYDGDGQADIAVFRPLTGEWFILLSSTGTGRVTTWGGGADIPVPGDYDGDGKADVAVFRPSTGDWFIINSSTGTGTVITWGGGADIPILKRP